MGPQMSGKAHHEDILEGGQGRLGGGVLLLAGLHGELNRILDALVLHAFD